MPIPVYREMKVYLRLHQWFQQQNWHSGFEGCRKRGLLLFPPAKQRGVTWAPGSRSQGPGLVGELHLYSRLGVYNSLVPWSLSG